jgi:hypothetical protein
MGNRVRRREKERCEGDKKTEARAAFIYFSTDA